MSDARTATLRRLALLEAELATARREREALEATIGQLKGSLGGAGGSYSAGASPRGVLPSPGRRPFSP